MPSSQISIPGYRIVAEVGVGGLSTVYLAEQEKMFSRRVALKVMSAEIARNEGFGERFLREVKIASNLNHRNIVHIYDTGCIEGSYFLSMELLAGGDLTRYSGERVPPREAVRIVSSVLEALDYAADHGVVHRDIKPANVMFHEDGTPVLVDFGIAFQETVDPRFTPSGAMVGTPHYMSPEQVEGLSVDERSDIYSVGIVLFELLAGAPPYDGDSAFAIASRHRVDPVPKLPASCASFQPIVERAMAKLPGDRYQSAREFLHALASLDGFPIFTPAPAESEEAGASGWEVSPRDTPGGYVASPDDPATDDGHWSNARTDDRGGARGRAAAPWSRPSLWVLGLLLLGIAGSALWQARKLDAVWGGAEPLPSPEQAADMLDEEAGLAPDIEALSGALRARIERTSPVGETQLLAALNDGVQELQGAADNLSAEDIALEWKLLRTELQSSLAESPRRYTVGSSEAEIDQALSDCLQVIPDCERDWYATEAQREVILEPFTLAPTEASVQEFMEFVDQTGYVTTAEQRGYSYEYFRGGARRVAGLSWRDPYVPGEAALPELPVTHLSSRDALAYCEWRGGRLPSADEWEYASRGPERRRYTWGDQWQPALAPIRTAMPLAAGSRDQNAYFVGLTDMTGNVWEWVTLPGGGYGLKGGSHRELIPANLRSAAQRDEIEGLTLLDDGVRCASDATAWPATREATRGKS